MKKSRLEELCINAIEWAVNHSENITHDLVRGMGITSDELEEIGYDRDNFESLHDVLDKD